MQAELFETVGDNEFCRFGPVPLPMVVGRDPVAEFCRACPPVDRVEADGSNGCRVSGTQEVDSLLVRHLPFEELTFLLAVGGSGSTDRSLDTRVVDVFVEEVDVLVLGGSEGDAAAGEEHGTGHSRRSTRGKDGTDQRGQPFSSRSAR